MPAVSEKQRIAMAIAEHHPGKLYKRNRGMAGMTHEQLHDFAKTKGLNESQRKSTKGSPEWSDSEISKGYRSLGSAYHPKKKPTSSVGIVEASPKNMPVLATGGTTSVTSGK